MTTERGMLTSMLAGLWVMGVIGVRYPLQMLPVGSPRLSQDLLQIGNGPILFGLIIPWGYVWRQYVKQPAERWR